MTATDELRRLLDERGVEWMPSVWSAKDETFYKVGEVGYLATEMSSGRMKVGIEGYLAPEQAIEATLGRGECRMIHERGTWTCDECGEFIPVSEIEDKTGYVICWDFCPNCGRKVVDA